MTRRRQTGITVELKVSLSKRFPPGMYEVRFGPYRLRAIPNATAGEAVLMFNDSYGKAAGGSHPEEEASLVLKFMSLMLNVMVDKGPMRLNAIDLDHASQVEQIYPEMFGLLDPAGITVSLRRLSSMDEDLMRQFTRACHAYSFAIKFIPSDATFAFFLLVVAIECMSCQDAVIPYAQLHADKKKCERFCHFIMTYLPDEAKGKDEHDDELFKHLLKTTYYVHRSGFAHGGRPVSSAAVMADKARSSYFKHQVDGKEVKTPGIGWFARMVRGALIGYLGTVPKRKYV